jgi:hypothetical protein
MRRSVALSHYAELFEAEERPQQPGKQVVQFALHATAASALFDLLDHTRSGRVDPVDIFAHLR